MLLQHRRQSVERVTIWDDIGGLNSYPKGHDPAMPYLNWSSEGADGKIWRCAYLPPGMSIEEADRLRGEGQREAAELHLLHEDAKCFQS
jgi:hypothetical protein